MTPNRRKNNAKLWLERALLAAGLVCVGIWAASKVVPAVWQSWANGVFDRAVSSASRHLPGAAAPAAPLETGHLIGRLSIPRLSMTSIVREGDDETTLSLALGHIPGTALPGQSGNVGVAGHRDTLFRALKEIHKNDVIRFETVSGTRLYRVDSTQIVKPEDVAVLAPDGKRKLTLVTCYPFYYIGSAPDRFIVSAHELSGRDLDQREAAAPETPLRPAAYHPQSTPQSTPQPTPSHLTPYSALAVRPAAAANAIAFEIRKGHGQEVAPGISIGVSDTDPETGSVYGWIWLMPDHRSILVKDQAEGDPFVFYQDGLRRELRFTGVSAGAVTGHLSMAAR